MSKKINESWQPMMCARIFSNKYHYPRRVCKGFSFDLFFEFHKISIFIFVFCVPWVSSAFYKEPIVDAFQICMNRITKDRMICTEGCGMILQQCYDEGLSDMKDKAAGLMTKISSENGNECADLAKAYVDKASHMEAELETEVDSAPGRIGSELKLNLWRHRLDNLTLIHRSCKSN